jgi:hypothetical protein
MLMQSVSPLEIQQVGPVASRINPLQGVAKVLQGYMAGKEQADVKKEATALGDRYKSDLAGGIQDYFRKAEGYEAPESPAIGAEMVKVPGDKKAAIMEAIASNHPVLQAMGMKQLEGLQKGEDLGEVGGIVYDKGTRQIVKLGGPTPSHIVKDGDTYELNPSTGQYKKLDNAPKIVNNVSSNPVIMGQKEGMKKYWETAAAQVDALGKGAAQATEMLPKIQKLEELNKSGVMSNVTANPAVFVSNLSQVLGANVDVSKLRNSEDFKAISTKLWVDMIQTSGGARGWTEPETKKIEQVLPMLNHSPQARADLIQMLKEKAQRDIKVYKSANQSFAKAASMDDPAVFANEFADIYSSPVPHVPSAVVPGKSINPNATKW